MIKNEKQYQITKKKLSEFKAATRDIVVDPAKEILLKELEINGLNSQIEKFEQEIREYEMLKNAAAFFIPVCSLWDFNIALIKARITRGWTQAELGERMGLNEQQIQRYEASGYETASMHRLQEVSEALELEASGFNLYLRQDNYAFSESIDQEALAKANRKIREQKSLIGI
jgi:transcriptional regulator with XRE-family HTH domain